MFNLIIYLALLGLIYSFLTSNKLIFIICLIIICISKIIQDIFFSSKNNIQNSCEYTSKAFLTPTELNFYYKLKPLEDNYTIIPQVNLATIIQKQNSHYHNELFRNIDFGIFTKDMQLLLLIELNDSSHNQKARQKRDMQVKQLLNKCHIPLITFYTSYPNEQSYVLNRILKAINQDKK